MVYYSRPFSKRTILSISQQAVSTIISLESEARDKNVDVDIQTLDPFANWYNAAVQKEIDLQSPGGKTLASVEKFRSDFRGVEAADVVLVDFREGNSNSIGCSHEIAWAKALKKLCIMVLPKQVERDTHFFNLISPDIIVETMDEAVEQIVQHAYECNP